MRGGLLLSLRAHSAPVHGSWKIDYVFTRVCRLVFVHRAIEAKPLSSKGSGIAT